MTRTVKRKTVNDPVAPETAERAFADNRLAMELFGSHHRNLARIEQVMDVAINARGNEVTITGDADAVNGAARVLDGLYGRLEKGHEVNGEEVEAVLRMAKAPGGDIADADLTIRTRKRHISPRSSGQADYLRAIDDVKLVFGEGPAKPIWRSPRGSSGWSRVLSTVSSCRARRSKRASNWVSCLATCAKKWTRT